MQNGRSRSGWWPQAFWVSTSRRSETLANLICADATQFVTLLPRLQGRGPRCIPLLEAEVAKQVSPDAPDQDKEIQAKRQANAGAALLRMDCPKRAWPLLKHSPDPSVRSYLIHRLARLGVDPKSIIARLEKEEEVSIRRALFLALGEYDERAVPAARPTESIPKLLKQYRGSRRRHPWRDRVAVAEVGAARTNYCISTASLPALKPKTAPGMSRPEAKRW